MKRIFIIINLVLLTGIVYLSVETLYGVLVARMDTPAPQPSRRTRSRASVEASVPPLSVYKPITGRNLFKTGEVAEKVVKTVAVDTLKQTELKLKLWGTVIGQNEAACAVIEETKGRTQNLYRVGDSIQNAVVKMILREKVVLNVDGRDEILEIEKLRSGKASRVSRKTKPVQRPQNLSIQRQDVVKALEDTEGLMKQVRFRPHFTDGKPDGLMLTGIKPGSIFRKMGLRNGDIIVGVDETDIRSVDDALGFYQNLQSSSQATLQIKRRGRLRTMNYTIK
jgi:general secretion pathway protein C